MPRYAAIDIGSNSTRMMAAEVDPKAPRKTLAEDRQVTRLGESVFRDGQISAQAMEFVMGVLKRFADTYKKLDVAGVRAVATSAVRDASNQAEFLERAAGAIGSPVEIISGQEEARLIHVGVQDHWPHPDQRLLIIDVGGGSAEVIVGEDGKLADAVSRPLGAVRLTEVFLKDDPPTALQLHQLDEFLEQKLHSVLDRIKRKRFDRVIATSASASAVVCAANRIPRPRREEADRHRATTPQLRKLYKQLSQLDVAARRRVTGIGPRRAEIIVPGVAVFLHVLEALKLPSLYYSRAGVRDGIIADLAARGVGHDIGRLDRDQRRAVEELARRFSVDLKHARLVAALGHRLFVEMQPLHRLPSEQGKLLEAAALLRDTGHIISDTAHHKHSQYIVANADLPGFNPTERAMVAELCRYHRKSMPGPKHGSYQALPPESRRIVNLLIPLLRIADALDRSREQRVEEIDCHLSNGEVALTILSRKDTGLEQWAAERAGESFRMVYGKPLVVARADS
ncbi:MAG: Ppx/GppA phosphatase family protein [Bryobacteraceae bacterium]|nr:Ppx/GppA phosphatase family protein [Bryobacteraceae bacterium]